MKLFVAGLRKLVRRPATYVTFGLLVGLLALIYIAVGATARQATGDGSEGALLLLTFPGAYTLLLSFILGLGGLFAMIYGAAIAGSEWTWGTLKAAVARGESRSRYQLVSFVSIAVMVGIALLVAFVVGVVVAIVAANLAQVPTSGVGDTATLGTLPNILGRGWLALAEACALGFAIATLARSQLAGIGVGIAIYFGESFAGDLPARCRQVHAVQRGRRGRPGDLHRWRWRRRRATSRTRRGTDRRVALVDRRAGRHGVVHRTGGDLRLTAHPSRTS